MGYDSPSQSSYITLEPPWGVNGMFPKILRKESAPSFHTRKKPHQVFFLNLLIKRFSLSLFAMKLAFNIVSPLFKTLCFMAV